jgi:hypothetical protein
MTMYRSALLVSAVVLVSLLLLAGCGGGGSGGAVTPPGAASTQAVYILDFVHHTVSTVVQAQYVERNPIPGTPSGNTPDLALTLAFPALQTGNPGREQITATVTNNTTGSVGVNDLGTVTGIDLCFVSTVFKNVSNAVVTGGGYGGYTSLNPADGTPIFTIPGALAAGATTNPGAQVSLIVPATATTATVRVVVRTATVFMNPPDLTHWYLTTLAGHAIISGYQDGPTASALFNGTKYSLYRENVGDVLVSDFLNGCIRRIYQGQVSTFATLSTPSGGFPPHPTGLGQDAAGNVYICDNANGWVEVVPPSGGAPVGICTGFTQPDGLAVTGNVVYVSGAGTGTIGELIWELLHSPSLSVSDPASWMPSNITNGAAVSAPSGVALDAAGNVYMADYGFNQVFVLPLGSNTWTVIAGTGGFSEVNGTGARASFLHPSGIAVDQSGIVYVADDGGALRRLVHTGGALTTPANWAVTTLVPSAAAPVNGFTGTGKVSGLFGVSCAHDGTLYLTENNDLRRLDRTRN